MDKGVDLLSYTTLHPVPSLVEGEQAAGTSNGHLMPSPSKTCKLKI
jgi:hypothetical protein